MDTPKGLRKPHRLAALVPLVLVFAGFAALAFSTFLYLAQQRAVTSAVSPGASAGTEPSMFQPEVLFGVGIVVLFVGLAWGLWRYNTRNRAYDPVTEAATREQYDHPETYAKDRRELGERLHRS